MTRVELSLVISRYSTGHWSSSWAYRCVEMDYIHKLCHDVHSDDRSVSPGCNQASLPGTSHTMCGIWFWVGLTVSLDSNLEMCD